MCYYKAYHYTLCGHMDTHLLLICRPFLAELNRISDPAQAGTATFPLLDAGPSCMPRLAAPEIGDKGNYIQYQTIQPYEIGPMVQQSYKFQVPEPAPYDNNAWQFNNNDPDPKGKGKQKEVAPTYGGGQGGQAGFYQPSISNQAGFNQPFFSNQQIQPNQPLWQQQDEPITGLCVECTNTVEQMRAMIQNEPYFGLTDESVLDIEKMRNYVEFVTGAYNLTKPWSEHIATADPLGLAFSNLDYPNQMDAGYPNQLGSGEGDDPVMRALMVNIANKGTNNRIQQHQELQERQNAMNSEGNGVASSSKKGPQFYHTPVYLQQQSYTGLPQTSHDVDMNEANDTTMSDGNDDSTGGDGSTCDQNNEDRFVRNVGCLEDPFYTPKDPNDKTPAIPNLFQPGKKKRQSKAAGKKRVRFSLDAKDEKEGDNEHDIDMASPTPNKFRPRRKEVSALKTKKGRRSVSAPNPDLGLAPNKYRQRPEEAQPLPARWRSALRSRSSGSPAKEDDDCYWG